MAWIQIKGYPETRMEIKLPKVVQKKSLPVTFKELWDKYPSKSLEHINAETKKDEFGNHCAINISETLYQNNIKLKYFKRS